MTKQKIKLIIWDFDGVIADTERLWLLNRQKMINEQLKINWDFETTNKYLGGMSDKTKKEVLSSLNIYTDDDFWNKLIDLDNKIMDKGFELTPYIEDIFKLKQFEQCIATGGTDAKTAKKIKIAGIAQYFNKQHIFTADMVENGKPAPDLFLLAAKKMGFEPSECLIVEDSLAGMQGGLKAGMKTIAFLGSDIYHNNKYLEEITKLGIENIFYDMRDVKTFLLNQ